MVTNNQLGSCPEQLRARILMLLHTIMRRIKIKNFTINFGPQHQVTHEVRRWLVELNSGNTFVSVATHPDLLHGAAVKHQTSDVNFLVTKIKAQNKLIFYLLLCLFAVALLMLLWVLCVFPGILLDPSADCSTPVPESLKAPERSA